MYSRLQLHQTYNTHNTLKVFGSPSEYRAQAYPDFFVTDEDLKKDYSSVEPNVSKENYKRCKNKKSEEIVTRKWDLDYTELFLMETKNAFSRIWIQVNSWRKNNQ